MVESTELVQWAFESRSWPKVMSTALLTRVFRQSDTEFVKVLNKIRVGELPHDDLWRKFVQQVSGNVLSDKAVCVRPLRTLVDKVNSEKFCQLPGHVYSYVLACVCCGWMWTCAGINVRAARPRVRRV